MVDRRRQLPASLPTVHDHSGKRSELHQRWVTTSRVRLVALLVTLFVSGCASPSLNDAPPSTAPVSSTRPTSTRPTVPGPGIAQRTLDPESPYQTTPEEYAIQLKACLADKGFSAEIDPYDFHFSFQVGDGQFEALQTTLTECRSGLDPSRNNPPPPLTPDQLRELYRYHLAQAACLVAAGYPASSAPPEQVFVDGGGQWDARMGLENADIPQTVIRACEQLEGRPRFLDW